MHRVTHKRVVRREDGDPVTYSEGDTFEPTDAELRAFGDRLAPVEDEPVADADGDDNADDAGSDGADASSLVDRLDDMTVPEVEDALASGDYNDQLAAIEAADDRKGVQQAVDARLEQAFADDE